MFQCKESHEEFSCYVNTTANMILVAIAFLLYSSKTNKLPTASLSASKLTEFEQKININTANTKTRQISFQYFFCFK